MQIDIINVVGEKCIRFCDESIIETNNSNIIKASIIDNALNYHKGVFINSKLEGIDCDRILKNNGIKQISLYNKLGDCLFFINSELMLTYDKSIVKAILTDSEKKVLLEGFFNREGKLKLVDFLRKEKNSEIF